MIRILVAFILMSFMFFYGAGFTYAKNSIKDNLDDPRIGVVVLSNNNGKVLHEESVESILNEMLVRLGFNHVMEVGHIIKLDDAQLLNSIYRGNTEPFENELDNSVDYLVIGKCVKDSSWIKIPYHEEGTSTMVDSPLGTVKINLKIDVIKYDTGEIIGTFSTEGMGIDNNPARASHKAVDIASDQAAKKLGATLKKFSLKNILNLSFSITAGNESELEEIIDTLRSIESVQHLYIREKTFRSAVISIDATQTPFVIVDSLKKRSHLEIFVDKLSANSCELRIYGTENFDNKFSDNRVAFDEED